MMRLPLAFHHLCGRTLDVARSHHNLASACSDRVEHGEGQRCPCSSCPCRALGPRRFRLWGRTGFGPPPLPELACPASPRDTAGGQLGEVSSGGRDQTCEGRLELTTRLPHASCGEVGGGGGHTSRVSTALRFGAASGTLDCAHIAHLRDDFAGLPRSANQNSRTPSEPKDTT